MDSITLEVMDEKYIDSLTGLGNEIFLNEKYNEYITANPEATLIMFDFQKFKHINDTYGHEEGDRCLKVFAKELRNYFRNSLIVRAHGDEFYCVTNYNQELIIKLLSLIQKSIIKKVDQGIIKYKFGFNSGSAYCIKDLEKTKDRADCMMYEAKNNRQMYQPYNDKIYQAKLEKDRTNRKFSDMIRNEEFSYYGRRLFDLKGDRSEFVQIYTKNRIGYSFLSNKVYDFIRDDSNITKFDLYNLQKLIESSSMSYTDNKYIMNIDYRSLLSIKELLPFFDDIKESTLKGIDNVIISVNIDGIESSEYDLVLDTLRILMHEGFKLRLDNVGSKIADYFVFSANPNYVKVDEKEWKGVYTCEKRYKILESKVSTYLLAGNNTRLMFDKVEKSEDVDMLRGICPEDTLISGNYYSKEKKLVVD